jgi:HK97 gp10 family phage protein
MPGGGTMTKLTFTGGPELERALRELGGQIAGRLGTNAVRAGGRVIVAEARRRVPVKSGALRKSIRVFSRTKRSGSTVEATAGTDLYYGKFVEHGTALVAARAFLRPAVDEGGQAAIDAIGDNLRVGIEREAAKLGRK